MARWTASAKWGEAPALDGQRAMPLALRLSEWLGLTRCSAKKAGEPVSVVPVGAQQAMLTIRVVLAFLVRTAEQPVGQDHRLDAMRFKKLQHGFQELRILPGVLIR